MKVIAFGHRSGMGKDTCVELAKTIISTQYGLSAKKMSFAKELKDMCHKLWGWTGLKSAAHYEQNRNERHEKLPFINLTPVELWVKFGQMVKSIHDNTWAYSAFNNIPICDVLLISDLRFACEIETVKKHGGVIVKVDNPTVPHFDTVADNALEGYAFDYTINNNGTLIQLSESVGQLIAEILKDKK